MSEAIPGDPTRRASLVRGAAFVVMALGVGAALSPGLDVPRGAPVIGALLFGAGAAELFAGNQRHAARAPAMLAGVLTMVAGLLFLTRSATHFLSALQIVAGWLALRSATLFVAGRRARGAVRRWTFFAAAMDLLLCAAFVVGLSIANLVVLLFGPTPAMIASFAWALAASFAITAAMLFNIAACIGADDA
ncbi:hypothetical protein ABDK56_07935 [Sphingomonas sp. ASV193]|uniref:hypothetical protein n=1 Tax=Sphingomonas sp. ASV193 TaxID=3144405 RepID=UPI0032E8AD4E